MKRIFLMGVLIAMASPAQAESSTRNVPPFPQSCSATAYGESCLHTFGGAVTRIPLAEIQGKSCRGKQVMLYQLSSWLAMPVGNPATMDENDCSAVSLFLPSVRQKTIFRVSVGLPDSKNKNSQTALVEVYPADILAPLKDWSNANRLIVNDRSNRLIPLLEHEHIRYTPFMMPEDKYTQRVCIWVPQLGSDAGNEPPFDCGSMLVLHEGSESLPHIHVLSMPRKLRTDVYMPLLADLPDNPLLQTTFADLIQSQL